MEEYGSADFPMVRYVPYMGVIWTVNEASKLGFYNGHPDWCNVGQGQPEVGTIDGAPDRIESLKLQPSDAAYGPVGGTPEVREAIADWVNRTYRKGMSQCLRRPPGFNASLQYLQRRRPNCL